MKTKIVVEEVIVEDAVETASAFDADTYRTSRWFRAGKHSLLILLFLLPIFFLPTTIAPVEISKTALIYAVTFFALLSYLAVCIEHRQFAYPRSRFTVAIALLVAVAGVSAWFSISPSVSTGGNFTDPNSFFNFLAYGALFFLAAYFFAEKDMGSIGRAFFGGATLTGVVGLLEAFGLHIFPWAFAKQGGFSTVGSWYGWGIIMGMGLACLSVMPYAHLPRRTRVLLFLAGAIFIAGLFVLNYPTIWVGTALLMIMISAARFVAEDRLGAPIALAVAAVCCALLSSDLPRIGSLPGEVLPSFSASWSVAKQAVHGRNIMLGSGPATFGYDYQLYRPLELNQTNFWSVRFDQGYNFFITFLATHGILGAIALLFLLSTFLKKMVSGFYDTLKAPLVAAMLMGLIGWLFHPSFLAGSAYLFMGFGLFAGFSGGRREVAMRGLRPSAAFVCFMALLLLAALSLASLYFLGQKYYAAYAYAKGIDASARGDIGSSIAYLENAVRVERSSDQYLRALSQALITQAGQKVQAGLEGDEVAEARNTIAAAEQAAVSATRINPADTLNWSNAGSIYEVLLPIAPGVEGSAYEQYNQAIARDPKNPTGPFNAARVRITAAEPFFGSSDKSQWSGRIAEAKTFLQKSLELKADYAPAHFLLAQLYLREGNIDDAVLRTEAIKNANPFDAGIAFQLGLLYYQSGETNLAGKEFERAVVLSDTYSNARYFLGLVYDKQGKSEAALAQFARIEELNPGNAEVARIVTNLKAGRHALQDISPPDTPPEKRAKVPVPEE